MRHLSKRWTCCLGASVFALMALAVPASAQEQPAAPPVLDPRSLQPGQCAPPSSVVVKAVPWAQTRLVPERAWPLSRGGGQLVAVIDTGVDGSVPQLAGKVEPGQDIVRGNAPAQDDCVGHGTFVAGIIAASQTPGIGLAGVAPDARILPIRQTTNGQDGTNSRMATAIHAAVDAGARVLNISAASSFSTSDLESAVDYAASRDVLIVAAVFNDAQNENAVSYPAAYPKVLAVAAVGPDSQRASFSAVGDYVDIAAPGVNVLSLAPGGSGHVLGSGTSFAAPFVAGTAALVRARYPDLTAAQVKHRLEATADHPASVLPSPAVGWGVVNPYAAVSRILPEEHGAAAVPARLTTVAGPAPAPSLGAGNAAALVVGGSAAVLGVCALAGALIVPRGRSRGWRPTGFEQPATGEEEVRA
ncbi:MULTISPECIES: type VII secretion-associated serine protease mycosin [Amycolatopsis]|uniref:Type VII secretion-associated serine protease mycosin n=1 Tax=Amycolatopsis albidoflavus TaxID=102226 RepID=A0ABW5I7N1_9PSEU